MARASAHLRADCETARSPQLSQLPEHLIGMGRCWSASLAVVVMVMASCGNSSPGATAPSPTAPHSTTPSAPPSTIPSAPPSTAPTTPHHGNDQQQAHLLCNPGLGRPTRSPTCPDPQPETGWLRYRTGEPLLLKPFRTLIDNAAGRGYARRHHLGFPFANDYLDAPLPGTLPLRLGPDTVCTGSLVGSRGPLQDHRVSCRLLIHAASAMPLPVAVWRADGHPVQVSELYRP
jgi:hypothetical protein